MAKTRKMKLVHTLFLSLLVIITRADNTVFSEKFDDGSWEDRWIISEHPDVLGKWRVDEGSEPYNFQGDRGLIVDSEARKHAISAPFKKPLDNTNKDLIVQYELRLQKDLDCGGAYIKLLTEATLPPKLTNFNNDVPYTIMFGPDKCGSTNKVHFIVRHKNPITKKYEEKHLKNPPSIKIDTLTHLYKLHIMNDNTFAISIDDKVEREGNMLEDFDPPFNPPKEIDDPEDKKPKDWVDEAKIPDSTAVKPDDWDESAPASIVDKDDTKPDDWLDDEPSTIPDPETSKPDDWDDDLDGDWEAPRIPNPKCKESGCGEWKPRVIPNPAYKGKWTLPLIDNPAYKGEWHPRKIANPNYFVDEHPHNLERMGAIGIEIWTMKDGILYDNILITHDEAEAESFTRDTWTKKQANEQAILDSEIAKKTPSTWQQLEKLLDAIVIYVTNPDNLLVVGGSFVVAIFVPIILCFVRTPRRERKQPKEEQSKKPKKETKEVEKEEKVKKSDSESTTENKNKRKKKLAQ